MKILLIYPGWTNEYYSRFNPARLFSRQYSVFPPLNLAYLASIAEEQGHLVRIYDGELHYAKMSNYLKQVKDFKPDLVGFTAYTPSFHLAENIAKEIKNKYDGSYNYIETIIGGAHFSAVFDKDKPDLLSPYFDYGFAGKALYAWKDFLKSPKLGVYHCKGNDGIQDIRPARHLLENTKYKRPTKNGVKNFTTIFTSIGCPFKCIFCWNENQEIIFRETKDVVDEIAKIKRDYGITHFVMLDDTLTINREKILSLCEAIIRENIDITFEGSTRANLIDDELMKYMCSAGLVAIGFGLETANEETRKKIGKNIDTSAYIKANKLANEYGIVTQNSCIIGLPGETIDSIKQTLKFLRGNKDIKQANISIATPYPGTELYRMAKNNENGLKLLTEDFSKYKRYGSAVMDVNGLSAEELVRIQEEAFGSIYIVPWRWKYTIKRSGILGLIMDLLKIAKLILTGRWRFLWLNSSS